MPTLDHILDQIWARVSQMEFIWPVRLVVESDRTGFRLEGKYVLRGDRRAQLTLEVWGAASRGDVIELPLNVRLTSRGGVVEFTIGDEAPRYLH